MGTPRAATSVWLGGAHRPHPTRDGSAPAGIWPTRMPTGRKTQVWLEIGLPLQILFPFQWERDRGLDGFTHSLLKNEYAGEQDA